MTIETRLEDKLGSKVLDIATGIGEPAITAAKKVRNGNAGHVLATDIAPQMLYIAKQGKDSKGLANLGLVEVERGDRGKIIISLTTLGKLLVTSNTLSTNSL